MGLYNNACDIYDTHGIVGVILYTIVVLIVLYLIFYIFMRWIEHMVAESYRKMWRQRVCKVAMTTSKPCDSESDH